MAWKWLIFHFWVNNFLRSKLDYFLKYRPYPSLFNTVLIVFCLLFIFLQREGKYKCMNEVLKTSQSTDNYDILFEHYNVHDNFR